LERRRKENKEEEKKIPVLERVGREEALPLSYAQQRLWFLDQLTPGSAAYNLPFAMKINEKIDLEALRLSLRQVIGRHEALRTTFVIQNGIPVQIIASEFELPLEEINLSSLPYPERESEARRLVAEEAGQAFDLLKGPLIRIKLLRLDEEDYVLLLTMHHIVSDGWSIGIMVREFGQFYAGHRNSEKVELPELQIQYADYAVWQRKWLQGEVLERQVDYWRKRLEGTPPLNVPTDRPRPALMSQRGSYVRIDLNAGLTSQLRELSRAEGATLFMTLLAAFQLLLSRYSGQDDVAIGAPIAGRKRTETNGLIGFFINTLVLRTHISPGLTFRQLLEQVRQRTLEAYEHQDVPFEKLVEELQPERDLSRQPFFQVMLALENTGFASLQIPGLKLVPFAANNKNRAAKFDLTLSLLEAAEEVGGVLEYNTDLFDETTASRMVRRFVVLLEQIVQDADQLTSRLALMTQEERQVLAQGWAGSVPERVLRQTVGSLLADHSQSNPQAIALIHGGRQLCYDDLNRLSDQWAYSLVKQGVVPGTRIAVCFEQSEDRIIAALGVLKSGAVVIGLSPEEPGLRMKQILNSSNALLGLGDPKFNDVFGRAIKLLDVAQCRSELGSLQLAEIDSQELACVMYQSSVTGLPAGVMIRHQELCLPLLRSALSITSSDRIAMSMDFSRGMDCMEVFRAWSCGAGIVSLPNSPLPPRKLAGMLRDHKVTLLWTSGAQLERIAGEFPWALKSVRGIICHEPIGVLQRLNATLAQDVLTRVYVPNGEVEAGGLWMISPLADVLANVMREEHLSGGVRLHLLDDELEPVPEGMVGEICLAGDLVALGYDHDSVQTARAFLPDPFAKDPGARLYRTAARACRRTDGTLEYVGRRDGRLVIGGMRVEAAEIELAIQKDIRIKHALVAMKEAYPGETKLTAYIDKKVDAAELDLDELRICLRERLPEFMVPAEFIEVDKLFLSADGTVDRARSPKLKPDPMESDLSPVDDLELQLSRIWGDVLKVSRFGRRQTFFELGGHSLLAVELVARIKEQFGQELPLSVVFEVSTFEKIANVLRSGNTSLQRSNLVPLKPGGSKPPVFLVHPAGGGATSYLTLARLFNQDQPVYGIQALNEEEIKLDKPLSLEERSAKYLEAVRTVQPHGPYFLGGWSFGGYVAYEMAQQLRRMNEDVGALLLLDITAVSPRETREESPNAKALELEDAEFLLRIVKGESPVEFSLEAVQHEGPEERLQYLVNQMIAAQLLAPKTTLPQVRDFITGWKRRAQSVNDYDMRPFLGTITMVRATERPPSSERPDLDPNDETAGFAKLSPEPVRVYPVQGARHANLVFPPFAEKVKEIIEKCMQDAEHQPAYSAKKPRMAEPWAIGSQALAADD
jgi:non-ribosomal peptide synthetase component F/thioesterase domain-containing protein